MIRKFATRQQQDDTRPLGSSVWTALLVPAFLIGFSGCAQIPPHGLRSGVSAARDAGYTDAGTETLGVALTRLTSNVNPQEAIAIADAATNCAAKLTREYRLVRPPWLHNLWVNLGLRERGLCHHFASDLEAELKRLPLNTLTVRWGMARAGTWREHNAIVITAKDAPFASGIVLDAWRNSGQLYWGPVAADRYLWTEGFLKDAEAQP